MAARAGRRRGRDHLRRQLRHRPRQVRPARSPGAPRSLGRRDLDLVRPVPVRRLDRRRPGRSRAGRRPAHHPRRTSSGSAGRAAGVGLGTGGPLRPGGSRARPVQSPAVAAPGRRARGRRDHHQGRPRDRVGDQPRAHRRLRRRHPRSRLWHEPRDRRQRLCGRRAPGTVRPGRRRRAVPSRVRTRAARDLGRRGVPGRRRGHLGPGPRRRSAASGRVTASGRRTPPRSRSPESATAGTCT